MVIKSNEFEKEWVLGRLDGDLCVQQDERYSIEIYVKIRK